MCRLKQRINHRRWTGEGYANFYPFLQHAHSRRDTVRAMIGKEFQLLHAKNGNEVIELFETKHPDLILMDMKMPGLNGLEAAMAIRRKSPAHPPIIAVSAYAYETDRKELLENGCDDFLAKPLNRETLLDTLHKYV